MRGEARKSLVNLVAVSFNGEAMSKPNPRVHSNIDFSRYVLAAAAVGTLGTARNADADFTSPYALNPPPNGSYTGASVNGTFGDWTSTLTYVPSSGSDSLVTNQPTSVTLNLTDFQFMGPTDNFDLVATAAGTGMVSFNWSLTSTGFMPLSFGYLVNGGFTPIANSTSNNSTSFSVAAGDVFGFRLIANYGSQGGVAISSFAAPVPEPSITMLVASGAIGLLAMRAVRRRSLARN